MKKQNTEVAAGEVIVLTQGEYSDYGIEGYLVACIELDLSKCIIDFKIQDNGDKWDQHENFVAWLITTEKAIPVKHREIHIGSYDYLAIR